jgi:hypothetical protein
VAKLLKPFGVSPKSLRFEDGTRKGYYRPDLRDAFARYLPPRPEQAEQVSTDASAAIVGVRNSSTGVPARGSPEEPHPACSVPPVPAQGGGSADAQALVHPQLDLDLDLDLDPGTAARLAKGWEPLGGWGSRAEEGES